MSEIPPDLNGFEPNIERFLAGRRRQRLAQFDQNALAWLALVPAWTEQLARECDFPGKEQLYDFVKETQTAGLSQVHQSTNLERSTWHIAYAYTMFAPYLPEARQRDALTFVQQIRDDRLRSQSLVKLAPHLAEEFVLPMLATAQAIRHPAIRATSLLSLIPRLPEEQRPRLLAELVDVVCLMTNTEEHIEAW